MNIEMIVQNTDTRKAYNVSNLVKSIAYENQLELSAGKLTFTLIEDQDYLNEGSPVSLKVEGNKIFWGYVFKYSKNEKRETEVTAYDQIRYLKYKDTYITSGKTCDQIFEMICRDYQIKSKVVTPSLYVLPKRVDDNKTLADIIQYALDRTMVDTGDWFFLRDEYGELQHLNIYEERTNLVIGDNSLMTGFTYESSIDDDTYNQVKLLKENKETKKREIYIVKDSSTIDKWGALQYFETVDEKLNSAQIEAMADRYLESYNKPRKKLKIPCIGDWRIKPGKGVVLMISDLKSNVPYNAYVFVNKVTHNLKNHSHTMDLELMVV